MMRGGRRDEKGIVGGAERQGVENVLHGHVGF